MNSQKKRITGAVIFSRYAYKAEELLGSSTYVDPNIEKVLIELATRYNSKMRDIEGK